MILLLFSFLVSTRDSTPQSVAPAPASVDEDKESSELSSVESVARTHPRKRRRTKSPTPPSIYPPSLLENTVREFLALADPASLELLTSLPPPTSASSPSESTSTIPSSRWDILHQDDTVKVCQNSSNKHLYSISAEFTGVPLRKLYEVLTDLDKRTEWDSMCSGVEELEEINLDPGQSRVSLKTASVAWVGMKGLGAIVKAKVSRPLWIFRGIIC